MKRDDLIVVRGGGDLATGVVHRLWSAGLRVLVLETAHPAAIRRQVSLCEAVYEGETAVEGMRGIRVETLADADAIWAQNAVPVLIDPTGACLPQARPAVLVDAIIAKKNLGTTREMAPLTIALGPGRRDFLEGRWLETEERKAPRWNLSIHVFQEHLDFRKSRHHRGREWARDACLMCLSSLCQE